MMVPIVVVATTHPAPGLLPHVGTDTTLIADSTTIQDLEAHRHAARGRVTISESDVHHRSAGCDCCAVREDLVASIVRATRRRTTPQRLAVIVNPLVDDVLTVVSTILSSVDISRRCELDAVVADLDAVELATRSASFGVLFRGSIEADPTLTAVSIADRILLRGSEQVTAEALGAVRSALASRSGFGVLADSEVPLMHPGLHFDAWHGAPQATDVDPASTDQPATVVLRVDEPLDAGAIDEWLDQLVARHASRLLRVQGALSVAGNDERTCLFGVRSFATSHSEREHIRQRSTESVLAICGLGLDAEELATTFRATVAS